MENGSELAALRAEIEALQSKVVELEALRARVVALEARGSGASVRGEWDGTGGSGAGVGVAMPTSSLTGRRALLKRAGAAAAGAAVAGTAMALGEATPAAAANGGSLLIGATNVGSNSYTALNISNATGAGHLLMVQEGSSNPSTNTLAAAVAGYATGSLQSGVFGYNTAPHLPPGNPKYGGRFYSSGIGVRARGDHAAMLLEPLGTPPPTRSVYHSQGELVVDTSGTLWYCTATGNPGTWHRLMGATNDAGSLTILPATVRCYDSRVGSPPAGGTKGKITSAATRQIDTTNNSTGVPAGATAVLVNLTVANTSVAGFLALFKGGIAWPGTSSINWDHAGQAIANLAVVALDPTAKIAAYCTAGASCDFIIDVIGYYQ
jgi:hypothetical protein